jgi:hypothetical protein
MVDPTEALRDCDASEAGDIGALVIGIEGFFGLDMDGARGLPDLIDAPFGTAEMRDLLLTLVDFVSVLERAP